MDIFSNIPQEEQQKEWFCLWKPIIKTLTKCHNKEDLKLLNLLKTDNKTNTWRTLKCLTEFALYHCKNTPQIFSRISSKIKYDADNQNEIIYAMFAELQSIPLLKLLGIDDLAYQRENGIDLRGIIKLIEKPCQIEVTYIEGESGRTQEEINSDNLLNHESDKTNKHFSIKSYRLCLYPLINLLMRKYKQKEEHISKQGANTYNIIVICTLLKEVDSYWFDDEKIEGNHPIQHFVDEREVPTIILGPHSIVYMSKRLDGILLPFDKDKYIEMAYGRNVKVAVAENAIIQQRLADIFEKAATGEY